METFKIKAILATAEYKSLSKAAEVFSYTPSAFSHMLASFEKELGVRIFERHSKGVVLTEAGKKLYPYFQKMVLCEKNLQQTLDAVKSAEPHILRIGAYSSLSRQFLSLFTQKLKKEYPGIRLSIQVADTLINWIEDDKADLIFADERSLRTREWFPLAEDRFYVVAPPGMIKEKETVTREELYQYPHIYTDDFYIRPYFETKKFKEFIYFKSEDDLSLLNMVKDGLGVTVVPELVLRETLSGVSVLKLEPELKRRVGFAYSKERIRALGLTEFIKALKTQGVQHE